MAKYSYEFKKKVVASYLNGEGSQGDLMKKYNIPTKRDLQNWIANYKAFGDEGLVRSKENQKYTFEYKMYVVELYLSEEVSYQELALSQGIKNSSTISGWVNAFKRAGPDALRPKMKGRENSLKSKDKKTKGNTASQTVDTNAEYVKKLEKELLKLRIENAYLKELRRLRLEEEALQKKQRELYTVSEDSSD